MPKGFLVPGLGRASSSLWAQQRLSECRSPSKGLRQARRRESGWRSASKEPRRVRPSSAVPARPGRPRRRLRPVGSRVRRSDCGGGCRQRGPRAATGGAGDRRGSHGESRRQTPGCLFTSCGCHWRGLCGRRNCTSRRYGPWNARLGLSPLRIRHVVRRRSLAEQKREARQSPIDLERHRGINADPHDKKPVLSGHRDLLDEATGLGRHDGGRDGQGHPDDDLAPDPLHRFAPPAPRALDTESRTTPGGVEVDPRHGDVGLGG